MLFEVLQSKIGANQQLLQRITDDLKDIEDDPIQEEPADAEESKQQEPANKRQKIEDPVKNG